MILVKIALLICLFVIFIQDMKYRAVSWIIFPVTAGLCYFAQEGSTNFAGIAFNIAFISIQLFLLWLYFSLKNRKAVNLLSAHIGLGDLLFLYSITFFFSPVTFLLFYISSLILVILFVIVQRIVWSDVNKEIPLAGLQALLMCVFIGLSSIYPGLESLQESYIYGY